jgi:transcriptional regulator with XRE-family HTH domain
VSRLFSQHENNFSLQRYRVDAVGKGLLQRVNDLLAARPDLGREDLGRAIRRGKPWISEFFSGKRTTNDVRLVHKMAKFFGVPPGYLVNGDSDRKEDDAKTVTMLGAWAELDADLRDTVLQLALRLRPRRPPDGK